MKKTNLTVIGALLLATSLSAGQAFALNPTYKPWIHEHVQAATPTPGPAFIQSGGPQPMNANGTLINNGVGCTALIPNPNANLPGQHTWLEVPVGTPGSIMQGNCVYQEPGPVMQQVWNPYLGMYSTIPMGAPLPGCPWTGPNIGMCYPSYH